MVFCLCLLNTALNHKKRKSCQCTVSAILKWKESITRARTRALVWTSDLCQFTTLAYSPILENLEMPSSFFMLWKLLLYLHSWNMTQTDVAANVCFLFPSCFDRAMSNQQSSTFSIQKGCFSWMGLNECGRLAARLLGVVVTFSSASWLRNAMDDSYFYMIASRPERRSGTSGWAHGSTCSKDQNVGWCSGMNVRIIIIQRMWRLTYFFQTFDLQVPWKPLCQHLRILVPDITLHLPQ